MGIEGYVLYSKNTADSKAIPMLKVLQFDPQSPPKIRLPLGSFDFSVEIVDIWGAKSMFVIAQGVQVFQPTDEDRISFEESGIKDDLQVNRLYLQGYLL